MNYSTCCYEWSIGGLAVQKYRVENQKLFVYVCIFGDDFRCFWETHADDHPPTEKPVEGNDT